MLDLRDTTSRPCHHIFGNSILLSIYHITYTIPCYCRLNIKSHVDIKKFKVQEPPDVIEVAFSHQISMSDIHEF